MISNLSYQLIYTLIWLVLPRLFMTVYGSAINGLILSIRQFLNFFYIVEAGIGLTSITALLKPLASGDRNGANRILSSAKVLYKRAGLIFLSLTIMLAVIYPFIIAGQVSYTLSFSLVLILGFSIFLDFFIIGKYKVLLVADQREYVLTAIQIISLIFNLIAYLVLIKFGMHILFVNGIASIMLLSRSIMVASYIKKNYSHVSFKEKPDTAVFAQRKDVFIHQITGVIVFNSPIIVITLFLGLKEVSVYTTYNMVFSAIIMLVTSFSGSLFAGIGDLLVRGEMQKVKEVFMIFESIYFAMIAWAFSTTFILILPFIEVYTRGVSDAEYIRPELAILFISVGAVSNIRIPAQTLIHSAGHFKQTKNRAIAEAAINLSASLFFVQIFGMEGVLIGALCSYLYRTTDIIFYASRKILDHSLTLTIYKLGINLLLSVAAVLPIQLFLTIQPKNFIEWTGYALLLSAWNFGIIIVGNILADPKMSMSIFQRGKLILSRKREVMH